MSRAMTRVSSSTASRCGRVGRVDAVEHRLDVAGDDRQRRAQLVADVGQEQATLALVDVEPLDHRVEAARQVAHGSDASARAMPTRTV